MATLSTKLTSIVLMFRSRTHSTKSVLRPNNLVALGSKISIVVSKFIEEVTSMGLDMGEINMTHKFGQSKMF